MAHVQSCEMACFQTMRLDDVCMRVCACEYSETASPNRQTSALARFRARRLAKREDGDGSGTLRGTKKEKPDESSDSEGRPDRRLMPRLDRADGPLFKVAMGT